MMRRLSLVLSISLGLLAPAWADGPRIGISPDAPNDFSGDQLFADTVKHCRGFVDPGAPWKGYDGTVPLDAQGWPAADFGYVFGATPGTYTFLIDGYANLALWETNGKLTQSYDAPSDTTTAVAVVDPGNNAAWIVCTGTKRTPTSPVGSGVRRVRSLRPIAPGSDTSHDPGETFSRTLLAGLKPFKVVRDLDLGSVNNFAPGQSEWGGRTTVAMPRQYQFSGGAGMGCAYEYRIALANALGADLWLCVPDVASDDYATKLFTLCRDGSADVAPLKGRLYFEWGNEIWNAAFPAYTRNLAAAQVAIAAGDATLDPVNPPDATQRGNQYYAGSRRVGQQLVRLSRIAASVYGQDGLGTRYFPVLASQEGNPITLNLGLEWIAANAGPPSKVITHGGGAFYRSFRVEAGTADQVFAGGIAGGDSIAADGATLAGYGLKQANYEGGLTPPTDPTLFGAIETDPRFGPAVRQVLDESAASDLLMAYNTTQGVWRLTPTMANLGTPKYLATVAAIGGASSPAPTPTPTPTPAADPVVVAPVTPPITPPVVVDSPASRLDAYTAAQAQADADAAAASAARTQAQADAAAVQAANDRASASNRAAFDAQVKADASAAAAAQRKAAVSSALKRVGKPVVRTGGDGSILILSPTPDGSGFQSTPAVDAGVPISATIATPAAA